MCIWGMAPQGIPLACHPLFDVSPGAACTSCTSLSMTLLVPLGLQLDCWCHLDCNYKVAITNSKGGWGGGSIQLPSPFFGEARLQNCGSPALNQGGNAQRETIALNECDPGLIQSMSWLYCKVCGEVWDRFFSGMLDMIETLCWTDSLPSSPS